MVIFTQQLKFLSRVIQAILIHSRFSKDMARGPREARATSHSKRHGKWLYWQPSGTKGMALCRSRKSPWIPDCLHVTSIAGSALTDGSFSPQKVQMVLMCPSSSVLVDWGMESVYLSMCLGWLPQLVWVYWVCIWLQVLQSQTNTRRKISLPNMNLCCGLYSLLIINLIGW